MADLANSVGTFLTLATSWYKNATAHSTASATLKNHLRNFAHFHTHIWDPIEAFFLLNRQKRQNPLLLYRAVRVLHLDISLQDWLADAGFRPARRNIVVVVARRSRGSAPPRHYLVKRKESEHGRLALPWFGVTGKEVAFFALFEKLIEAYEKVEADYPPDAYGFISTVVGYQFVNCIELPTI